MVKDEVSIVIVSMNRMDNLNICIPSIEKYTKCAHKIYVVAYMFSKENLDELKRKYPQVIIVESNEIRGFSENNNLALRQVTSEYVFIQNDDTEYKEPVLDKLLESLKKTPEATVMSPKLLLGDGSVQFCGIRKYDFSTFMLATLGVHKFGKSKYENGIGIFKTYNISGAAFLIRTADFKNVGFFDERFFFSPEDFALSTKINKMGGSCYTDATTSIIHYHGKSSKKTKLFYATTIATFVGNFLFYCDSHAKKDIYRNAIQFKYQIMRFLNCVHPTNHRNDYLYIYKHVIRAIKKNMPPKELFLEEYKKVNKILNI